MGCGQCGGWCCAPLDPESAAASTQFSAFTRETSPPLFPFRMGRAGIKQSLHRTQRDRTHANVRSRCQASRPRSCSFHGRVLSVPRRLTNVNICASQCEESERRYPAFWRSQRVLADPGPICGFAFSKGTSSALAALQSIVGQARANTQTL
jgi:hypothetical protein